jgi:periplasmic copper chaperone A
MGPGGVGEPLSSTRRWVAPVLLAMAIPGCHAPSGGRARAGDLTVSHAVVTTAPGPGSQASAFLVVDNRGETTVTLVGVRSPAARTAQVHAITGGRMQPVSQIAVPARGRLLLVPGRYHLMLDSLIRPLALGDSVPLELQFQPAATLSVRAPVLRYGDAVKDLPQ